jgi:chorismate-pyruvate lyase
VSLFPLRFAEQSPDLHAEIGRLPAVLRTLLVADGTVTRLLEAYFWEPFRVRLLTQEHLREPASPSGEEVERLHRIVVIEGASRGPLVWARSVISLDRLEPQFRHALLKGDAGIGELIREDRIETYRHIDYVGLGRAGALGTVFAAPAEAVVARRRYCIHRFGEVLIELEEVFPTEAFGSPSLIGRRARTAEKLLSRSD